MQDSELTGKELSRLLDLTPGRVSQLAAQGKITRLANGKFPGTAVTEYIRFIRKEAEASNPASEELLREKLRKMRRENDIEEAKVAPVALIADTIQKAGRIIVAHLDNIPLLIKRNWPEMTGDQVTLVRRTIAECRNAIADMRIDDDPDKIRLEQ